ncbi:preprotein translocase subunit SecA [Anaerovoracaceae bacterium SGI.195]
MGLLEKIFGDLNEKEVKKIGKIADEIEALDGEMQALSDEELRAKTDEFKGRLNAGETLDDILVEAFAVCREAASRSLGMKHFRVQLIGGVVLHQGRIAEMKTGEGKTLVATLPAYLNALSGKGVHVITVNDYLAKRDADWMGKLYSFLGLTVGCVIHGITQEERHRSYRSDITYGTNNEFGFDYLRDNMVIYRDDMVQRELNYAIIDEVDSILIDEARTPLIISGQGDESSEMYNRADDFVKGLKNEEDYTLEEKDKQVSLTDEGVTKAENYFGIENFGDPENMEINHHVLQALKAHTIMEKDVNYIVKDGEVVIVDEFTGRLMFGRRFSNGLHQAIEAKERVRVQSESKTLATITLQNYFRTYQKLAGMTGTAKTEEEEFREIYNMDVVTIPTNKPIRRVDLDDSVYKTEAAKFKAIADTVTEIHSTGQPVLVGTISIEKSELLSKLLSKRGVKHNVLNAKQHEREAEIVAEAGREGTVTIATNMAGRGTDILLGGNPEFEAKKAMRRDGYSDEAISFATGFTKTDNKEMNDARAKFNEYLEKFKAEREPEHRKIVDLGGLVIIGTERHESRRIDNQLRGRAGRQGDPGRTQFFISLEDELMRLFGGDRMQAIVDKVGLDDGEAIEAKMLSRSIEGAQKKVETKNFGIRKYVLQYDNVMNKQREIIYDQRRRVLFDEDMKDAILDMAHELIDEIVTPITLESKFPEEWDLKALEKNLMRITDKLKGSVDFNQEQISELDADGLKEYLYEEFDRIYDEKEAEIGAEKMRSVERMILLRVVDNMWMDHIDAMDQLKTGIGLRGIGQQDPAAAYSHEGFDMFEQMIAEIREQTVKFCCNVTVETESARRNIVKVSQEVKEEYKDEEANRNDGEAKQMPIRRDAPKVGRNDPCPCGSGKKYKNCHGRNL